RLRRSDRLWSRNTGELRGGNRDGRAIGCHELRTQRAGGRIARESAVANVGALVERHELTFEALGLGCLATATSDTIPTAFGDRVPAGDRIREEPRDAETGRWGGGCRLVVASGRSERRQRSCIASDLGSTRSEPHETAERPGGTQLVGETISCGFS